MSGCIDSTRGGIVSSETLDWVALGVIREKALFRRWRSSAWASIIHARSVGRGLQVVGGRGDRRGLERRGRCGADRGKFSHIHLVLCNNVPKHALNLRWSSVCLDDV